VSPDLSFLQSFNLTSPLVHSFVHQPPPSPSLSKKY
jgi:hypothetical protein